ncbi:MAG: restriction endonuclease subunit S [Desulfuromonadales bacterium]|nr:restriction endonuclease subunit S [Desulfuromonadales bacterium]
MTSHPSFVPSCLRVSKVLEQHFDTAFAAPNGIKKLRELILTLAMQGKLVEQDANDPPASELLKEIEAEKKRISHEGTKTRRGKEKKLPPIKPEEVPYELPQGWEWVRLGDIVLSITGGGTPSKNNPAFWGGDIPWASVKDLNVETYLDSTIDSITEKAIRSSSTNLIPKGSIIVCTRMGLGKIAINRVAVAINQDLKALTISSHVDQMFFYKKYKNYKITGSGMTVYGIRQDELLNFLFPLPPLPEQHRIVARIDQLMARCDELEKLRKEREEKRLAVHAAAIKQLLAPTLRAFAPSREEIFSNLRAFVPSCETKEPFDFLAQHFTKLYTVKENVAELRKAILQLAVMGRLVPQDAGDPPASELLKEIEAEKQRLVKAGKIKKPKPLPPIKPEEMPYQLPQGWEWVRFGDLTTEIATGPFGSMIHKSDYVSDGIPLINPSHMIDGKIAHDSSVSVSQNMAKKLNSYRLFENDIVMARRGEMGRCAIVTTESDGFLCGTGSFVLRFIDNIDRQYILNLFKTEYVREYLGGNSVGTTMTNLNHGILNNMPVLLPSLPEQHRIVARIDQLMSLCDTLDQQIDAATGKQTELLSAVMAGM